MVLQSGEIEHDDYVELLIAKHFGNDYVFQNECDTNDYDDHSTSTDCSKKYCSGYCSH